MSDWDIVDHKLVKEFVYKDFVEAVRFVNSIADIAEARNHHPDIFLHSYNKVRVTLYTHSAKAITDNDYDLALAIDNIGKHWYL